MRTPPPYPGPLQAALLTLLGAFLASSVDVAAQPLVGSTAALGLATAVGLGAAGALGATRIPRPHGARVGLRGLRIRQLLPLLLLLPVALLASEVDNAVLAAFPAPDAPQLAQQVREKLPTDAGLAFLESLLVAVGLVPLVEEWFFRGVIQQGLVARLGARSGVLLTAMLFALGHAGPGLSPGSWGALVAQTLVLGLVFGIARHKTGSLLAAVFLHVGVNLAGVLALAYASRVPIAGYNAPGAHTPVPLIVPAAFSVALGLALLAREHAPRIPEVPVAGDPEGDGGPFGV
jgi:membrane protease YdiL (CAAX protease family)